MVPAGEVGLGERVSGSWSEDVARLAGDDTRVVCYMTYVWSLPFALGREVPVVKYRGELAYGMGWPDAGEVAWDEKRLREEWNSGRRVFVILKEKHLKNLLAEGIEPAWRRIDPGRSYMIVSNRPPATPATPAEGTQ